MISRSSIFQVPATPFTPPGRRAFLRCHCAGHAGHSMRITKLVHHRVDGGFSVEDFAAYRRRWFFSESPPPPPPPPPRRWPRRCDAAMLRTWPVRWMPWGSHGVGQIFPRARDGPFLPPVHRASFRTDFGATRSLSARTMTTGPPWVDGVVELENFALHVDVIFLDNRPVATAVVTAAMCAPGRSSWMPSNSPGRSNLSGTATLSLPACRRFLP